MAQQAEPANTGSPESMDTGGAWFLHVLDGRRLGPLTIDEVRAYYTSGMVRAQDRVIGPGMSGPLPAPEVAALLQVRAPVDTSPQLRAPPLIPTAASSAPPAEAATTAQAPHAPSAGGMSPAVPPSPQAFRPASRFDMAEAPPGLGWRFALLWLAVLFVVQMSSLPVGALGATHSLRAFIAASLLRFLSVAAGCTAVVMLLSRLLRGRWADAKDALLAMTLVFAVLFGNRFLQPPPRAASGNVQAATEASGQAGRFSVVGELSRAQAPSQAQLQAPSASTVAAPAARIKRDWFGEGKILGAKGDWEAVLKLATEWTIAEPDEPAAWSMQGLAYDELGQPHQAIKAYKYALHLDPESAITWDNLGCVYEHLGQHQDAINAHSKALQLDPRFPSPWNNIGVVHARTSQNADAIDAFKKAVELDPSFVKAWNNLGSMYRDIGRYSDAAATYRQALQVEPGNANATDGLSDALAMEQRASGGS